MKTAPSIRWRVHLTIALLLAALTHALTVWALPRVIMDRIITLGGGDAVAQRSGTGVYLPPATDHTQRRIVMPSPDLRYATCAFDLSARPLRISLDTDYPRYWSIALYAANSDNFFVINHRDAKDGRVDLLLLGPTAGETQDTRFPPAIPRITSPTARGFLLMRLLVNDDPAVGAAAERARQSLRCLP